MQTQIPAQQTQQNQSRTEQKKQQSTQPQFEDSRPEAAAQLRMQSLMANSAQSTQVKSMQAMMAANTPAKKLGQSPGAINPIPLQRMEDEEPLQAKTDESLQREQAETPPESPPTPKPNNTGLPDNLKSGIENLSGMSMDHVKVHYNSDKPAQLQAHAYAQGNEIHVAPGQEQHLPHEAWHIVQQAQGRVRPTVQMKGDVQVNDDEGLEREADVMGETTSQFIKARSQGAIQKTLFAIECGRHSKNALNPAMQLKKYKNFNELKIELNSEPSFSYLTEGQRESVAKEFFDWYSKKYKKSFRTVDVKSVMELKALIDEIIGEVDSFTDDEGQKLTDLINQASGEWLSIGYHAGGENKNNSTASKPFGEGEIGSQIGQGYYVAKDMDVAKEYANQYIFQGMVANIQEVFVDMRNIKNTLQIKGISVTEWWDKYNNDNDEIFDIVVASISGKSGKIQYKVNPKHEKSGLLKMVERIKSEKNID